MAASYNVVLPPFTYNFVWITSAGPFPVPGISSFFNWCFCPWVSSCNGSSPTVSKKTWNFGSWRFASVSVQIIFGLAFGQVLNWYDFVEETPALGDLWMSSADCFWPCIWTVLPLCDFIEQIISVPFSFFPQVLWFNFTISHGLFHSNQAYHKMLDGLTTVIDHPSIVGDWL